MISALDTNILLDILLPDTNYYQNSKALIDKAYAGGALIICEAVYAELACQFDSHDELDGFLSDTGIRLVPSTRKALYVAGTAWRSYTSRRGPQFQCTSCGNLRILSCPKCGATITSRQHIVTDFIIGGHALVQADRLLSRDRGFYHAYFPDLKINT
ncbi:MAG TPA: type II toxin-antitoxin system VapC family toxin [Firmicutes bacterium]|nr:type II toxin-antitoxin system VapC family toxin [Bacillota bacterium]HHY97163.1 type II toxin-antitoxin system VapC family toxin [Bacillota bacterium]